MQVGTMVGCPLEVLHGQRNVGSAMLLIVLDEFHSGAFRSQDTTVSLPYVLLYLAPPCDVIHPCRYDLRHGCEVLPDFVQRHGLLGSCDGGPVAVPRCIRFRDVVVQAFPPALWWSLDARAA